MGNLFRNANDADSANAEQPAIHEYGKTSASHIPKKVKKQSRTTQPNLNRFTKFQRNLVGKMFQFKKNYNNP